MLNIGMYIVLVLAGLSSLLACILFGKHLLNGKSIYTKNTNTSVAKLLEQEKEIYKQINQEIKNAGIINKMILKKKMGPLYKWYEGGFINGKN